MNPINSHVLLDKLHAGLVPIAAPQPHVCHTCRSGASLGSQVCRQCEKNQVSSVLPISMSRHGELLHTHLRGYKDGGPKQREKYTLTLAALLHLFLKQHEACIGGQFDLVTTVRSKNRDAMKAIVRKIGRLRQRHIALTSTRTGQLPEFSAPSCVDAKRVLLLDDTLTTGKSLTAAHKALTEAGADVLCPVVIGRHFHPNYDTSRFLAKCLDGHKWTLNRCGVCRPIKCNQDLNPSSREKLFN